VADCTSAEEYALMPVVLFFLLMQMMAVLSEALLYCTEGTLRMQALSGWLVFVQLLAAHAPAVLQRVAAHAAVVLLPVLELTSEQVGSTSAGTATAKAAEGAAAAAAAGEVDTAAVQLAAEVLHEIVVKQRQHVRAALRNMPPLPSLDVLKEVNQVLAQVRVTSVTCR
jgi:type IV secretory pathway VirJ component